MGIGDFAIDIVMFSLAVFTYLKPKRVKQTDDFEQYSYFNFIVMTT